MNNAINLNYLTRLTGSLQTGSMVQQPTVRSSNFQNMVTQLKAETASPAAAVSQAADMDLEAYKQTVWNKISQLPMSLSSQMQSISIQITDEGFEAMKNDPEYEAWVLDTLGKNFLFENPWTSVCGGGYVIHHFGATKEEYHGESWYPGYMGGEGASLFAEKSKGSFWEHRAERHKEYMELQQKAAAKQRMLMKLRNGDSVSVAELLMDLL